MNILGEDGGYAPIAPGPIDSARRKQRHQYTLKIKKPHGTILITPVIFTTNGVSKSHKHKSIPAPVNSSHH